MPTLLPCCMHVPKLLLDPRALLPIRHVCYPFAKLMLSNLNVRNAQHADHTVVVVGHNPAEAGAEVGRS